MQARHDEFRGIVNAKPLGLDEGGTVAPLDLSVLKSKMKEKSDYLCGVNAAWISWSWTITPDVPVNRTGVTCPSQKHLMFKTAFIHPVIYNDVFADDACDEGSWWFGFDLT